MTNNKDELNKEKSDKKEESAEERGKKAIEAHKKLNLPDKPDGEKDKEEKKDAEQWRNEG